MKGKIKTSSLMVIAILLICTFVFTPMETFAASKGQPQYFRCIKKGNIEYCTNCDKLFIVNLMTKEVKTIKRAEVGYIDHMLIKGKYLYFMEQSQGISMSSLYRMNLKSGKVKRLVKNVCGGYRIAGKKIYYDKYVKGKSLTYSMKLNGKSKRRMKTKKNLSMKCADTNTPGYRVIGISTNVMNISNYYLQTPTGYIYLEQFYTYF